MTGGKTQQDPAVDLLYANIGHLSDPHFGSIALMPFSHESDRINALKKRVCDAIVNLFRESGYPMELHSEPVVSRDVTIRCRSCGTVLLHARVDDAGTANVPAEAVIAGLGKMNTECPHAVITADDQRRRIEQAFLVARDGSNE